MPGSVLHNFYVSFSIQFLQRYWAMCLTETMTVLQEKKWGIRIIETDQIVQLVSSRSRLPNTHTQMRSAFKYLLFLKAISIHELKTQKLLSNQTHLFECFMSFPLFKIGNSTGDTLWLLPSSRSSAFSKGQLEIFKRAKLIPHTQCLCKRMLVMAFWIVSLLKWTSVQGTSNS